MRRIVAVIVVALFASSLVGCGGGGGSASETPSTPAPKPAAPAGSAPASASAEVTVGATFVPFPVTKQTPAEVTRRLDSGQPMLLLFVDPGQSETDIARNEIEDVISKNGGLVDLIEYDVTKYSSVDASGVITIESAELASDTVGQQALELAKTLQVGATPYMILVDDQGYIIYRFRGFLDTDMLERQFQRIQ
jgi:cytochrome oxidase Cu insertion factor (SCO1/SenC/PrrC family)